MCTYIYIYTNIRSAPLYTIYDSSYDIIDYDPIQYTIKHTTRALAPQPYKSASSGAGRPLSLSLSIYVYTCTYIHNMYMLVY